MMADPISILSDCIRLANEIYDFKETINYDDAASSDFFYRIQALQVDLKKLQQGSQNAKKESLDLINESLSSMLNILNTRVKNKSSVLGISSSLSDLIFDLELCVNAVQLCSTVDIDSADSDLSTMMLQSQTAAAASKRSLNDKVELMDTSGSSEGVYVREPAPEDSDDERYVLGRGAFGVTQRMRNKIDKALYAVKVIRVMDAQKNGVDVDDLTREACLLQQLNHPHVERYFTSYLSKQGKFFNVVMELVSGVSLEEKIKDASVDVDCIRRWLGQVASVLIYLHYEMRVQHRDVKPENIILTSPDNSIKLINLLAIRAVSKVSLIYSSYEKANDIPYDGRDDVWGAGCVFAELLVKTRLSERGGAIHMFHKETVNDRRLLLIDECVKVDGGLGLMIGRMLEPEQEHRCTSEELVRLLSVEMTSWEMGRSSVAKFSPDGSVIAVAPYKSNILIYDPSGRLISTMEESDKKVRSMSFSPDGTKLAAISSCVKLFEVSSGRLLWSTTVNYAIQACFFNSSTLVASCVQRGCFIIDVSSGSITSEISATGNRGLCVSNRGTLITAGREKVTIWDNLSSLRLSFGCSDLWSMCINSDGSLIYVGIKKGDIRVYSDSGLVIRELKKAHGSACVKSLIMNETNSVLASGGDDKKVKLWNASTLECILTLGSHTGWLYSVSFSYNNSDFLCLNADGIVKVLAADSIVTLPDSNLPAVTVTPVKPASSGGNSSNDNIELPKPEEYIPMLEDDVDIDLEDLEDLLDLEDSGKRKHAHRPPNDDEDDDSDDQKPPKK